jgi:hypothetical protein
LSSIGVVVIEVFEVFEGNEAPIAAIIEPESTGKH